ncbi:hypothetical protein ACFX14_020072 [Malus domestica]
MLLDQLGDLQKNWDQNFDDIKEKTRIVDDLWAHEESYWLQRSRVAWLREGDANTKFFHQSTVQRRRRNQVLKIQDDAGNWVEQPGRIPKIVEDHFIHTFSSGGPRN